MNWDNYREWYIDHIRPISNFNFNLCEDEEFKECQALENLQSLWAEENLRKGFFEIQISKVVDPQTFGYNSMLFYRLITPQL